MKLSRLKKVTLAVTLILGVLLLLQFVWHTTQPGETPLSSEHVNLALRRTAHHLLLASGDSTTRIPAVETIGERTWQVRLEHAFDYDQLPPLLQSSLEVHQIQAPYNVSVFSCSDTVLQLGYNFMDFKRDSAASCGGRDLAAGCYLLQVSFSEAATPRLPVPLAGGVVAGALVFLALSGLVRRKPIEVTAAAPEAPPVETGLPFGLSRLDVTNQMLDCGGVSHSLTFRETKLLHLFVTHQNQLLERRTILEQVWADEGVLVGRSVDMFVSRLRKLLRADATLQLVAVHGVGYKLQVENTTPQTG
jgi:Transcriptional regulatory protein, C terminal